MKVTTIVRCLILTLPLALFGCGGQHDHAHGDEHAHDHGDDADHAHAADAEPTHAADGAEAVTTAAVTPTEVAALYSCPMHPEVTAAEPGRCSKCNMFLTRPNADHGHDHAEGEDHDHAHDGETAHEAGGQDESKDEHSHDHGDKSHEH